MFLVEVMERADLHVPGIPHHGKLEKGIEDLRWKHFLCCHDLGVARELGHRAVPRPVAEPLGIPHQVVPWILVEERLQGSAQARSAGLWNVHEKKLEMRRI